MKLIIAGGRDFSDLAFMRTIVDSYETIDEIVSGCARGADRLGERVAGEMNIPIRLVPAEWHKFGKQAGPIRNRIMAKYADELLVFWDGDSIGTQNMMMTMRRLDKPLTIIRY